MAIALVGTPTTVIGATVTSTTVTITVPTGSTGDLLIIGVTAGREVTTNSTAPLITASSANTVLIERIPGDLFNSAIFYRFVQGGDPSTYTFTINAGAPLAAVCARYSGVSSSTPFREWNVFGGFSSNTAVGTSSTFPSSYNNVQGTDLALVFGSMGNNGSSTTQVSTLSTPASWTNVVNTLGPTSGSTSSFHMACAMYSRAGGIDTPTFSGSTGSYGALRIVLIDSSAPVPDGSGGSISFINSATATTTLTGTTSLAVNKPTGVVNGHLLIMAASQSCGATTFTAPAGWTSIGVGSGRYLLGSVSGTQDCVAQVWYKIASSEPSNYTVSVSGGFTAQEMVLAIAAYSGVRPISPIDLCAVTNYTGPSAASTTSVAPYALPQVRSDNLIVNIYAAGGDSSGTFTLTGPSAPWSQRAQIISAVSTDFNAALHITDKLAAADVPTVTVSKASTFATFSLSLVGLSPITAISTSAASVDGVRTQTGTVTATATTAATSVNAGLAVATTATTTAAASVAATVVGPGVVNPPTTSASSVVGVRTDTAGLTSPITSASSIAATVVGPGAVTATITSATAFAGSRTDTVTLTSQITSADTIVGARTQTGSVDVSITSAAEIDGVRTQSGDVAGSSTSASTVDATPVGPAQTTAAITSVGVTTVQRIQLGDIDTSVTSAGTAIAERIQSGDIDDPVVVGADVIADVVGPGEVTQTVHGDSTVDGIRTQYGDVTTSTASVDDTEALAVGPGQITSSTAADIDLVGIRIQPGDLDAITTATTLLVGQTVGPGILDIRATSGANVIGAVSKHGDVDAEITSTALVAPYQYDTAKLGAEATINAAISAVRIQIARLTPTVTASVVPWVVRTDTATVTAATTATSTIVGLALGDGGPGDVDIAAESESSTDAQRTDDAELTGEIISISVASAFRADSAVTISATTTAPEITGYLTGGGVIDGAAVLAAEITAYLTEAGRVGGETTCLALVGV